MKKILLPIIAAAVLAGCNKQEVHSVTATKIVEITITNGADATKAVTAPAATDQVVCAETDLTALFADASGNIKQSAAFTADAKADGKYTFTGVPAVVSQVAVVALQGNTLPGTLSEVATLVAQTEQVDAEAGKMMAYGVDTDPASAQGTNGVYTLSAEVEVLPAHARIEVGSVSCTEFGNYSKITLGQMGLASNKYVQSLGNAELTSATDAATAGDNKVWSWNILEQNVSDLVVTMAAETGLFSVDQTVTVKSYKDGSDDINKFEAGKVYKFDIAFAESNMDADALTSISAEVSVTVGTWTLTETTIGFNTNN